MFDILTEGDFLAQAAHVGWGLAIVYTIAAFGLPIWAATLITIGFAFGKEYVEVKWGLWEPKQPWQSSLRDFVFWCVGIAGATLVLSLR